MLWLVKSQLTTESDSLKWHCYFNVHCNDVTSTYVSKSCVSTCKWIEERRFSSQAFHLFVHLILVANVLHFMPIKLISFSFFILHLHLWLRMLVIYKRVWKLKKWTCCVPSECMEPCTLMTPSGTNTGFICLDLRTLHPMESNESMNGKSHMPTISSFSPLPG